MLRARTAGDPTRGPARAARVAVFASVLASGAAHAQPAPLPTLPGPPPTYAPPPGWGEPVPPPSASSSAAPPAVPAPAPAPAPEPPAKKGRGAWRQFRAGSDLVGSVPMAAILDGGWSIATQINTSLVDRTWTTPRPYGTIGHYTRRFLYGLSWTIMLGVEGMVAITAHGGKLDWIGGASYRTDWIMPLDLPACSRVGVNGGCGLGVGNMAFISIAPRHSKWWYEAGGGWFEQRVLYDPIRTLGESTWMLTPISIVREFATDPEGAVALRWLVGPGVYGGMHSGNMHPSVRGQDVYPGFRKTELYPFDGGVGPGARTELAVIILRHLTLEGDLTFAPLLAGFSNGGIPRAVEPLNYPRSGMPTWRRLNFGVGFQDYKIVPFKPVLEFFGAELSARPLDRLGYRGVMMRFDIPLKVPGD